MESLKEKTMDDKRLREYIEDLNIQYTDLKYKFNNSLYADERESIREEMKELTKTIQELREELDEE